MSELFFLLPFTATDRNKTWYETYTKPRVDTLYNRNCDWEPFYSASFMCQTVLQRDTSQNYIGNCIKVIMCHPSWLVLIFIIRKNHIIIIKFMFWYSVGQCQSCTERKEGQDLITSPTAAGKCPQLRVMSGSVLIHLISILEKVKGFQTLGAELGVALLTTFLCRNPSPGIINSLNAERSFIY